MVLSGRKFLTPSIGATQTFAQTPQVQSHRVKNLPVLLGHRGARASDVPENTLPAFDLCLQHGCDGFEFDVRLTADGHAVVCHGRKSGGLALARTNLGKLEHLPLLEDVVASYSKRAFLNIELKVPGIEHQLLSALHDHAPERGYVVSSFLPEIVIELRARSELIPLGIIFDRRLPPWRDLPVNYVIPHRSLVTAALVEKVHRAGKYVMTWTVNAKAAMLRFANWGVDGIISDKTDLLVRTLRPNHTSGFSISSTD